MTEYKSELQKILLLENHDGLNDQLQVVCKNINEKELAYFFIDSIYLKCIIRYLIEDFWVQSKNSEAEISFDRFVKKFFNAELKPLLFLHSFFMDSSVEGLKIAEISLNLTETIVLDCIKTKAPSFQKTFLQISLQRMSELFELEYELNSNPNRKKEDTRISLYRTFDILDQVFGLDYILNEPASIDQKERLYEGAGAGVQSSYSTTLTALKYLNLTKGSKFIDLGSGYGRVGLTLGLLRPDIQFTGFEFVPERVAIANKASQRLLLDRNVQFVTQDLADPNFEIPMADAYYIFDSFSDETYGIIMNQLQVLTQTKKMTVITKGNARKWMNASFWSAPQEFNDGNICFFRSKARMMT